MPQDQGPYLALGVRAELVGQPRTYPPETKGRGPVGGFKRELMAADRRRPLGHDHHAEVATETIASGNLLADSLNVERNLGYQDDVAAPS